MEIIDINFLTGENKIVSENIKWSMENDTLFISTDNIRKIYLKTDIQFEQDDLIMGDAFERAYGDLSWSCVQDKLFSWYFLVKKNDRVLAFGVKTQPNALCWWKIQNGVVYFIADIGSGKNGLELKEKKLEVCTFVEKEYEIDPFEATCDFCEKMCGTKVLPKQPVYGGNDWYCNYGNNSYEKIINHTKKIAECAKGLKNRPYMVIDDGWQLCHHNIEAEDTYYNGGPWSYPNRRFGDMKALADEIKSYDVLPGIWFRPLYTVESLPVDMMLRQNGIRYTLDPSMPEALDIVRKDVKTIKSWGYKLIKHDFSTFDIFGKYGFDMDENITDEIEFSDKTQTTAQIIKNFYKTIREAAGDDVLIIGCNTISHIAAGYFEIQRTGDDTSGFEWERTKKMGINTLAFRMCQHNAFYAHDADCVGITTEISWDKNREWLDVLSKSGTPLFVSIAEDAFSDEIKEDITKAFKIASENTIISKPVDWFTSKTPKKWLTAFGEDEYNF